MLSPTASRILKRPTLKTTVISFVFFLSTLAPLCGQCCAGAQNSVTDSHDGRYRVEATSLKGTGHSNHGPYQFRFRTLRVKPDGATEEVGVFERAWNNTKHFNMSVCVSPTGNGFAMSSSLEEPVHFFSPDGTILATIDQHESQSVHSCRLCRKGQAPLECRLSGRTKFGHRTSVLWLPLFHVTGPETKWVSSQQPRVIVKDDIGFATVPQEDVRWLLRMLVWRPEQGEQGSDRVKSLRVNDKAPV